MSRDLLRQVRVLDPLSACDQVADVLIEDGVIRAIEVALSFEPAGDVQVRDCQGFILGPALVDLYSSSGEPGFEERETLASLGAAAIAGGFTRLTLLPNTQPVIDQPATLELVQKLCQRQLESAVSAFPTINMWGALTLDAGGECMSEVVALAAAGVVGFTDGKPIGNLVLLRRLLEYLKPLEKPISLWPCHFGLTGKGVVRDGVDSLRLGLPGIPELAETVSLASILELVEVIKTPIHVMRISTAAGLNLIQSAKQKGLPITASTTWMHLLCNSQDLRTYHPSLRLDPPLGTPDDQRALWNGVKTGILDAIAVDHAPYTYEEKTVPFAETPPGAIGLELALPLLWQRFVVTSQWSALELWQSLSSRAAHCLGQPAAVVQVGHPAELVLFDPGYSWIPSRQTLRSRSTNTPWLDTPVTGKVLQVWHSGSSAYPYN
jgi:dihydroorotase